MSESLEKAEKLLEIARYYNEHKSERLLASKLAAELKVSGKTVGKVRRMINTGIIAFNEKGEPYFTVPFEEVEEEIFKKKKMKSPETISKTTVAKTYQKAIAEESKSQTEQYLTLGRAIWQAFMQWAVKKGYTIDDVRRIPIHQIIIESLQKADQLEETQKILKETNEQLNMYKREVDPIMRLRQAATLIKDFLTFAVYAETLGFNIEDTDIIPYYQNLIGAYLKGETYA